MTHPSAETACSDLLLVSRAHVDLCRRTAAACRPAGAPARMRVR